jgi:hypothetical protein
MQQYGRDVSYPILNAYTSTAGNTAGPRVVRLWRVPNTDNYVRLANADHEAWPVNTSTALDNGISEPNRFIIAGVNTAPEDFPKSWYFPQGSYYKTSYAVSWWNKDYANSSSRRGFIRFRPVVVPEFVGIPPAAPDSVSATTRGFGLVQYFGRKVDNGVVQPLYGVGIVVMASIPNNPTDYQAVTFRKYLVFFIGDRCVWHYEFANPQQVAHATKTDGVWTPAVGANWISMRAGSGANDQSNPINIGVFTYSADDDITQSPMTGLQGALSGAASVDMPNTKIDLYTEHMVARVHIDLNGENQTPSGGATQADRTGTGNRQWFVPSITTGNDPSDPIGTWLGWSYWQFHTWLLGVQSPFREFTMSIPLNVSNPPSGPYQVRVRTLHQVDRPLNAPSYFVAFRGTNDGTHFPNSPQNATVYTPVAAPHPYNCCGWYRPWNNANSTEPQHRYWWVDHKIIHGVI